MGIIFKDENGNIVDSKQYHYDGGNLPKQNGGPAEENEIVANGMEVPLSHEKLTDRLWSVLAENIELKREVYTLNAKLKSLRELLD
jgi:hypothetical protein